MTEPKITKTNMSIPTALLHELDAAAGDRMIHRNRLIEMLLAEGLGRLKPVESLFQERKTDLDRQIEAEAER